ncbi:hypothetical protein [Romboutsia sp. 1001216sp1]|uniref:hypothetical protein n=1 Tax=Romboutsia sp. 1001216sp1 TaxID=2986997 RepID=UPI0023305951|nr:hypothetical protein [Romboutsia sp. 1001216sp1]
MLNWPQIIASPREITYSISGYNNKASNYIESFDVTIAYVGLTISTPTFNSFSSLKTLPLYFMITS